MIDFAGWRYYKGAQGVVIGIVSPDGCQSRGLIDPDVQKWLTAGNVPLPAL